MEGPVSASVKVMKQHSQRLFGLDLLRALAIISVVAGHFFMNTKFASTIFNTPSMLAQGICQYLFTSIGVPLFLMLTGYLNCRKKFERGYYPRIGRVLLDYLVISIITYLVLEFHNGYSLKDLIKGVLSFHTINYAWYIEMYVGLFLLIPFLNIMWNELVTKYNTTGALCWIATLMLLSSLPDFTNRYGFYFLPAYWNKLWILVYYFTGAYIRTFHGEQQPVWFLEHKKILVLLSSGICIFNAIISFCFFSHHDYVALLGGSPSPAAVILCFIIFLSLDKAKGFKILDVPVSILAKYSLDIYLFSYLFDQLIYPWVMKHLFVSQSQIFIWYVPIVGTVLICSLTASIVKEKLFAGGRFIWNKVYESCHRP